jgi:hypothetical protein
MAVGITLLPGSVMADITTYPSGGQSSTLPVTTLPSSDSLHLGLGSNSVDIDYSVSEGGFSVTFNHTNAGGTISLRTLATFPFIPAADVEYVITGDYASVAPAGQFMDAVYFLEDPVGGLFTYSYAHLVGDPVPDVSYSLNSLPGTTGTLLAGHLYYFDFYVSDGSFDGTNIQPASSSGSFQLTFIPEPGTALLVGSCGLAGAMLRRQERRRTRRDVLRGEGAGRR